MCMHIYVYMYREREREIDHFRNPNVGPISRSDPEPKEKALKRYWVVARPLKHGPGDGVLVAGVSSSDPASEHGSPRPAHLGVESFGEPHPTGSHPDCPHSPR